MVEAREAVPALVQIRYQNLGGCLIVRVAGEVGPQAAPFLRDSLIAKVAEGNARLVVDLSRVPSMDVAGLPALLAAQHEAEASGGSLRVVGVQPPVRKVLHGNVRRGGLVVDDEMSDALEATMEAAARTTQPISRR